MSVAVTYEPETSNAATVAYTSIDSAEAALRALRDVDVVEIRVEWPDGLRIRVWDSVENVHEALERHGGYILAEVDAQARCVLAPDYAEKNARTVPRRPLEPQRAWARELLRRIDRAAATTRNRGPSRNALPRPTTAQSAPPPPDGSQQAIESVTIAWSENDAVRAMRPNVFASLWDADAALARAFERDPVAGGYDKTAFCVRWRDGHTHEGRLDVSQESLAQAPGRGGLLRAHLHATARWLASDDHARMFIGLRPAEEIEANRAWGHELAWRLAYDLASHINHTARRNAAADHAEVALCG